MSESGKQLLLLVAIVVCLVLIVQPNALAALTKRQDAPRRVLSQAEMQLFTTTANTGEIVMVGANGVLIDQGSQSIRVGTSDIKMFVGGSQRLRIHDTTAEIGGSNNRYLEISTDATDLCYLDFHSQDARVVDYDTRIQSFGGSTSSRQGQLQYLAQTHVFDGNVGIGTTNPQSKLHVEGNIMSAAGVGGYYDCLNGINSNVNYGSGSAIILQTGQERNWMVRMAQYTGDGDNNYFFLDMSNPGSSTIGAAYSIRRTSNGSVFHNMSGSVGIGTGAPAAMLHVRGSTRVSLASNVASYSWPDTYTGQTNDHYIFRVYPEVAALNGNGGALAQAASIQLKAQDLTWGNNDPYIPGAELIIEGGKSLNASITGASMIFKTWNTEIMRIAPSGNVGIGTSTPELKLSVDGTFSAGYNHASIRVNPGNASTGYPGNAVHIFGNADANGGATLLVTSAHSLVADRNLLWVQRQGDGNYFQVRMDGYTYATWFGAGSKNFDIEHPLFNEPKKHLVHSSIEGPRNDLLYRGTVKLSNGKAQIVIDRDSVQKPEHAMTNGTFEALCRHPVFYLQNNDSFDRVIGKIQGGVLIIVCENPLSQDSINWMVIAERQDKIIRDSPTTDAEGYLKTEYSTA